MTRFSIIIATAVAMMGVATAQEVPAERGPYWAVGAQIGGGLEFVEVEDGRAELVDGGGYGGFARYGRAHNRYFALEAEAGFAAFDGIGGLVHGGGYAVGTLPIGPVDLRARGGLGIAAIDDVATIGVSVGVGGGIRLGNRQSLRLDATAFSTTLNGDADNVAVLLQIGYQRGF